MYLNVELKLTLAATQKCLNLLHDYLGPKTKKLWLQKHTLTHTRTNTLYYLDKVKVRVEIIARLAIISLSLESEDRAVVGQGN